MVLHVDYQQSGVGDLSALHVQSSVKGYVDYLDGFAVVSVNLLRTESRNWFYLKFFLQLLCKGEAHKRLTSSSRISKRILSGNRQSIVSYGSGDQERAATQD